MAHLHDVSDTDIHFKIDGVTRAIMNPDQIKDMIVQGDHNSERITFELPRYIDGHDMTLCDVVQIHYLNIENRTRKTYTGIYEVDDLEVSNEDPDTLTFSWLISRNATQYVGPLNFSIKFECTVDAIVEYAWNTIIYSELTVAESIDNVETVSNDYVDILKRWYDQLFGIENSVVTEIAITKTKAIQEIEDAKEGIVESGEEQVAKIEQAATEAVEEVESTKGSLIEIVTAQMDNINNTVNTALETINDKVVEVLGTIDDAKETALGDLAEATEESVKEVKKYYFIPNKATGENITLNDASDTAFENIRLFGKSVTDEYLESLKPVTTNNMIPYSFVKQMESDPRFTSCSVGADGFITISYTSDTSIGFNDSSFWIPSGSYNGLVEVIWGENVVPSDNYTLLRLWFEGPSTTASTYIVDLTTQKLIIDGLNGSKVANDPFVIDTLPMSYDLTLYLPAGTYTDLKIRVAINSGGSTSFVGYTGHPPVEVVTNSKNLIDPEIVESPVDLGDDYYGNPNGTLTFNPDGSFTITHDPSYPYDTYYQYSFELGNYDDVLEDGISYNLWMTCNREGFVGTNMPLYLTYDDSRYGSTDQTVGTFPFTIDKSYMTNIKVMAQFMIGSATFYPMINEGSEQLPFEPVNGYVITPDNPDLYSPTSLTLSVTGSETKNVVVSAEYGFLGLPVDELGTYTDLNNQQWVSDEVNFSEGQRIKRVFEKTITSSDYVSVTEVDDSTNCFAFTVYPGYDTDAYVLRTDIVALSNGFTYSAEEVSGNFHVETAGDNSWNGDARALFYVPSTITDVSGFMAEYGTDLKVQFALVGPLYYELSDTEVSGYKSLTTSKPTTTMTTNITPKAGIEATYILDIKNYIDTQIAKFHSGEV